ncbi:MAG: hypothetical protein AAF151_19880 [Cyanobacteria bacterium J06656_5]
MDNTLGNVNVQGDGASLTFAPVQIGTQIQTQIIQISTEEVTQRELNKVSPYKGLKRYNFSDRDYFFGRDALIVRLFEAINQKRFLLIAGASGCGKSSVIRAGLIPEIKSKLGSTQLFSFVFTPGRNPFESLHRCLLAEEQDYGFSEDEADIALSSNSETLVSVIQQLKQPEDRWLIFIDQFEEIFTNLDEDNEEQVTLRETFINAVMAVYQLADEAVRVVLAMRADFLEYFSIYPHLGSLANDNNIHLITDMHPDELRQAIEQPAAKHGVLFEESLVEQIIKEVQGQSGYLPLLQYTLNLLWATECRNLGQDGKPHIEDRTLNRSSYTALEGVRGALQARINKLYQQLDQEQQNATRQIFLKLVQILETDSGFRAVSRKAYRSEFTGDTVEDTLRKFIDENMVVSSYDYSSSGTVLIGGFANINKNATFEISHEIILSSWDVLRRWLEEFKDAIIFKNFLADDVYRWQKSLTIAEESGASKKAKDELLKGSRLDRAIELLQCDAFEPLGGLSETERQFIDASVAWQLEQRQRQAELETAKERNAVLDAANQQAKAIIRKGKISLTIIVPVALLASGIAVQAFRGFAMARAGTRLEQAGVSALRQLRSSELDALTSALRAAHDLKILTSERTELTDYPAVSPILALQKILDSIYEKNRLPAEQGEIKAATFDPKGENILTGGRDGSIQVWNLAGEKLAQIQAHEGGPLGSINSVSFSPDGKYFASASEDGTAGLWTSATGEQQAILAGHSGNIERIRFSPDSETVVTTGSNGEVFLWNQSGDRLGEFVGHEDKVLAVSFSPDGQTLVTAGNDGSIRVWNIVSRRVQTSWSGHGGEVVYDVNFSPDGQHLVSAGADQIARVWNLDGQEDVRLEGHRLLVTRSNFAPDGQVIATASDDGTVKLWNLNGEEIETFQGHRGVIWTAEFSPDGNSLLSTGRDGTARLWQINRYSAPRLAGLEKDANAVGLSSDGGLVAAAGDEGILSIWQASGKPIKSWPANTRGRIFTLDFSMDGQHIATGGIASGVTLWDLSGNVIAQLPSHGAFVNSIRFSSNGQFLATAGADSLARLWTAEGKEIATLAGHEDVISVITFSPDSSIVATADWNGHIKLWETSGKPIREWQGHDEQIRGLDFSSDGRRIATVDRAGNVRLWSHTAQQELEFFTYQSGVNTLSFIPGEDLLITGGMDGTARVWDLDGRQIAEFTHQEGAIWDLTSASDGYTILTGGDFGEIRLWTIYQLPELINQGCMRLNDYLIHFQPILKSEICTD